jgi:hypothetical protein
MVILTWVFDPKEIDMAMTGLLAIVILGCGGLMSIAAVVAVIYFIINQREK